MESALPVISQGGFCLLSAEEERRIAGRSGTVDCSPPPFRETYLPAGIKSPPWRTCYVPRTGTHSVGGDAMLVMGCCSEVRCKGRQAVRKAKIRHTWGNWCALVVGGPCPRKIALIPACGGSRDRADRPIGDPYPGGHTQPTSVLVAFLASRGKSYATLPLTLSFSHSSNSSRIAPTVT